MKSLNIIWLCQGGFLLESEGKRIVVDPYMSNRLYDMSKDETMNRMMPNPLPYEELKPDLVCFTHDHLDHYDPESVRSIIEIYPDCKFAGPSSTLEHFLKDGYNKSNFTKIDVGEKTSFDDVEIIATPAYHTDKLAIGLIFKIANQTVYISGDSIFCETLADDIKKAAGEKIDIMCICINGKLGNMTWQEAVKVVEKVSPRFVYPMHYGLFARNTEDPRPFMREVEKLGITTKEPSVKGMIFKA